MQNLFKNFSKIKILVFGDVMLDQYWWGSVDRISPEAPVPVLNLEKKSYVAGGAANVAANIAGLGARPILFGVTGRDPEGQSFPGILKKIKVPDEFLFSFEDRKTTTKTRIVGHQQQIVRIDQESTEKLSTAQEQLVWNKVEEVFEQADIILISDYAKGFVTDNLALRLITKARENNKIILIDPKGKKYEKYKKATLMTPNQKEALDATNYETIDNETIDLIGDTLLRDLSLEALIITRGEKGMMLFEKGQAPKNLNASARNVYDVTGAGDTVIATLAVAIGAGATFFEAAGLANIAAGIVVEEMGTTVIELEKLFAQYEEEQG